MVDPSDRSPETRTADPRAPLPRRYLAWLAAATVSRAGDAAMYFALGWAASAYGGTAAGLVITAVVVPRTVLLLLGGAIGDRLGARTVMILGDGTLAIATTVALVAVLLIGTPLWLLILVALVEGIVTAFYLPASGSMPRLLTDDAVLPRALALRGTMAQLADLVGGPFGGLLIGLLGFAAIAGVNSVTFWVVLAVLIVVRPTHDVDPAPRRSVLREASDGIWVVLHRPVIRTALLLTGWLAGLAIPVTSVLLPLLVRERGWTPTVGGLVLGGQALGAMGVGLLVSWLGVRSRPGRVAFSGLAAVVAGLGLLALGPAAWWAVVGGLVSGAGIALFTSHTGPLILRGAPMTHLARVQSVLSVVQSLTLVVTTPLLGIAATALGATTTIVICAVSIGGGALLAAFSTPFRRVRTGGEPTPTAMDGRASS